MPNQIKIGAILSYLSIFVGTAISLVYTPIMLRMLGQSEYGLISLSNSVVGYLSILNLGLGSAMVRYISKYKAEKNKEMEYGVMTLFLKLFSIIAFIVVVAGIILAFNVHGLFVESLSEDEFSKLQKLIVLMSFNMGIGMLSSVFYAVIMAYERFIFSKVVGIINTIIMPAIMLPLLWLGYKSVGITIAHSCLNLINVLIVCYYVFHFLKVRIRSIKFERQFLRELFSFSFYVVFAMVVDKVYWGTDQFILGAVSGTAAVAVYNIGSNFTTYFMQFSTAITGLFLPRLTEMDVKQVPQNEFSQLFIRVGRIQYLILAFVLIGFIGLGKKFIILWAGLDYGDAYLIALVILVPFTIPLIQNLALQLMYARNMHKFRSLVLFGIAIVNVILSIPMAKKYGGLGCAAVTGASFIIGQFLILNWFYWKKMELDVFAFWKSIFRLMLVSGAVITILLCMNTLFIDVTWKSFLIEAFIYTLIYIGVMWMFGLNEYEKELVLNFFKKKS